MSPLFAIALAIGCGVYLFTAGFFLTRVELRIGSTCEADPFAHFASAAPGTGGEGSSEDEGGDTDGGCWLPVFAADDGAAAAPSRAPFKRLVFLVIDGWRHDFAQPVDAGEGTQHAGGSHHFRGQMPLLADTLLACGANGSDSSSSSGRCSAQLYRFVADAPTVTAQRLKGLLSGSLPTFVDVSANFASGALGEDNWLVQLAARDERNARSRQHRLKQVDGSHGAGGSARSGDGADGSGGASVTVDRVFLGDDTWMHLFPPHSSPQPQTSLLSAVGAGDGSTSEGASAAVPSEGGSGRRGHGKQEGSAPGLRGQVFTITRPFPSFNVRDLHTVDDGVLAHLLPAVRGEMRRSSADDASSGGAEGGLPSVVIGHFLGVDHVGHRYNTPDHPDMATKLAQMDAAIRSIVDLLQGGKPGEGAAAASGPDPDTLFVVIGDHGMTSGGAHGGASAEETDAAMFMFAARPGLFNDAPMPRRAGTRFPTVRQIDMVPTLSLLLGIPIPFASLGAVFDDVAFQMPPATAPGATAGWQELSDSLATSQAAAVNAAQVWRYLHTYNGGASRLPAEDMARLAAAHAAAAAAHVHALLSAGTVAVEATVAFSGSDADAARSPGWQDGAATIASACEPLVGRPRNGGGLRSESAPKQISEPVHPLHMLMGWMSGHLQDAQAQAFLFHRARALHKCVATAVHVLQAAPAADTFPPPPLVEPAVAHLRTSAASWRSLVASAGDLCRDMWTQFDETLMVIGIAVISGSFLMLLHAAFAHGPALPSVPLWLLAAMLGGACVFALVRDPLSAVLSMAQLAAAAADTVLVLASALLDAAGDYTGSLVLLPVAAFASAARGVSDGLHGLQLSAGAVAAVARQRLVADVLRVVPPAAMVAVACWAAYLTAMQVGPRGTPATTPVAAQATTASQHRQSVSPLNVAALLLIVMRADSLFTNSFIVEEPAAMAFLAQSAIVIAYIAACRGVLRRSSRPAASIALMTTAALAWLLGLRFTQQRVGWLWPFPPSRVVASTAQGSASDVTDPSAPAPVVETGSGESSIGWVLEATPASASLTAAAACLLCPLVVAWLAHVALPAGLNAMAAKDSSTSVTAHPLKLLRLPRINVSVLASLALHASVVAFWFAQAYGFAETSAAVRLGLPRAVFFGSLLHCAATRLAGDRSGLSFYAGAAPAFQLLLGPGAAVMHTLLPVCAVCAAVMLAGVQPPALQPAAAGGNGLGFALQSLFCDESFLPLLAVAWSLPHWYFASGHGNQFNSIHFSAPFVGFDDYHLLFSGISVLLNTFGTTFLAAGVLSPLKLVQGATPTAAATPRPHSAALLRLTIPAALSLLCTCIFNFLARRHLMVWAIFAPKYVFEVFGGAALLAALLLGH